jgi:hypothetical protein
MSQPMTNAELEVLYQNAEMERYLGTVTLSDFLWERSEYALIHEGRDEIQDVNRRHSAFQREQTSLKRTN